LTDEIEDKQLKLRMREVIENSINIENDIANVCIFLKIIFRKIYRGLFFSINL